MHIHYSRMPYALHDIATLPEVVKKPCMASQALMHPVSTF